MQKKSNNIMLLLLLFICFVGTISSKIDLNHAIKLNPKIDFLKKKRASSTSVNQLEGAYTHVSDHDFLEASQSFYNAIEFENSAYPDSAGVKQALLFASSTCDLITSANSLDSSAKDVSSFLTAINLFQNAEDIFSQDPAASTAQTSLNVAANSFFNSTANFAKSIKSGYITTFSNKFQISLSAFSILTSVSSSSSNISDVADKILAAVDVLIVPENSISDEISDFETARNNLYSACAKLYQAAATIDESTSTMTNALFTSAANYRKSAAQSYELAQNKTRSKIEWLRCAKNILSLIGNTSVSGEAKSSLFSLAADAFLKAIDFSQDSLNVKEGLLIASVACNSAAIAHELNQTDAILLGTTLVTFKITTSNVINAVLNGGSSLNSSCDTLKTDANAYLQAIKSITSGATSDQILLGTAIGVSTANSESNLYKAIFSTLTATATESVTNYQAASTAFLVIANSSTTHTYNAAIDSSISLYGRANANIAAALCQILASLYSPSADGADVCIGLAGKCFNDAATRFVENYNAGPSVSKDDEVNGYRDAQRASFNAIKIIFSTHDNNILQDPFASLASAFYNSMIQYDTDAAGYKNSSILTKESLLLASLAANVAATVRSLNIDVNSVNAAGGIFGNLKKLFEKLSFHSTSLDFNKEFQAQTIIFIKDVSQVFSTKDYNENCETALEQAVIALEQASIIEPTTLRPAIYAKAAKKLANTLEWIAVQTPTNQAPTVKPILFPEFAKAHMSRASAKAYLLASLYEVDVLKTIDWQNKAAGAFKNSAILHKANTEDFVYTVISSDLLTTDDAKLSSVWFLTAAQTAFAQGKSITLNQLEAVADSFENAIRADLTLSTYATWTAAAQPLLLISALAHVAVAAKKIDDSAASTNEINLGFGVDNSTTANKTGVFGVKYLLDCAIKVIFNDQVKESVITTTTLPDILLLFGPTASSNSDNFTDYVLGMFPTATKQVILKMISSGVTTPTATSLLSYVRNTTPVYYSETVSTKSAAGSSVSANSTESTTTAAGQGCAGIASLSNVVSEGGVAIGDKYRAIKDLNSAVGHLRAAQALFQLGQSTNINTGVSNFQQAAAASYALSGDAFAASGNLNRAQQMYLKSAAQLLQITMTADNASFLGTALFNARKLDGSDQNGVQEGLLIASACAHITASADKQDIITSGVLITIEVITKRATLTNSIARMISVSNESSALQVKKDAFNYAVKAFSATNPFIVDQATGTKFLGFLAQTSAVSTLNPTSNSALKFISDAITPYDSAATIGEAGYTGFNSYVDQALDSVEGAWQAYLAAANFTTPTTTALGGIQDALLASHRLFLNATVMMAQVEQANGEDAIWYDSSSDAILAFENLANGMLSLSTLPPAVKTLGASGAWIAYAGSLFTPAQKTTLAISADYFATASKYLRKADFSTINESQSNAMLRDMQISSLVGGYQMFKESTNSNDFIATAPYFENALKNVESSNLNPDSDKLKEALLCSSIACNIAASADIIDGSAGKITLPEITSNSSGAWESIKTSLLATILDRVNDTGTAVTFTTLRDACKDWFGSNGIWASGSTPTETTLLKLVGGTSTGCAAFDLSSASTANLLAKAPFYKYVANDINLVTATLTTDLQLKTTLNCAISQAKKLQSVFESSAA